jgi:hypothetical protein
MKSILRAIARLPAEHAQTDGTPLIVRLQAFARAPAVPARTGLDVMKLQMLPA